MLVSRAVVTRLFLLLALGAIPSVGAQDKIVESPFGIAPFPSAMAYATNHGFAGKKVELAPEDTPARPGDEAIYLLTLQQASGRTQWFVRLISRQPDPAHGDATTLPGDTIHTSTGLELHYTNTPTALDIEFIGPFAPEGRNAPKVTVSRGHTLVSTESLESGIIRYCESALVISARMRVAGVENPYYTGSNAKFKADQIEAGKKAVAPFGLTPEDERRAFSVYFALRAFYQACSDIPACRDVLEQVIQKPSAWSLVKNLGVGMNFEYGWHRVQSLKLDDLPDAGPAYILPLRLSANQQPTLDAVLLATTTRPPLRTCAGIIALTAAHPTDEHKRVFLRLLSATPAGH